MWSRTVRRVLLASACVAVAALLGSSCADNEQSVFIRHALMGNCEFECDSGETSLFSGVFDVALSGSGAYHTVFLFGNQMRVSAKEVRGRTESNRVMLDNVIVRLERPDGSSLADEFTVPITGFADPGTETEPGYGCFSAMLMDPVTAAEITPEVQSFGSVPVVAFIRVVGRTLGGTEIESSEFAFPFVACACCLIDTAQDCSEEPTGAETPCYSGSNNAIDCRLLNGICGF